ncbi:hypothetical protein KKG72_06315 [bacterium]|nr:hypothetical protein [bacterium]MBU1993345.1 hypothetical protein [bacterium]
MKYSFISPRKKSAFSPEMQLLFIFFTITLLMLFLTYSFLFFKGYRYEQDKQNILQERSDLNISIYTMKNQIAFIEKESALSERIYTKNIVLKESLSNLFDLVPQRITLSEAKLLENGLILYGITPNQDVYNFMLQAPLRSIFHRTYSSFYPDKNGWLRFVSTNYIDEDKEQNSEH